MVKQARALKEDRRSALDARHKYLISRLSDAVSVTESEVEEALVSDSKFSLIDDFFAVNGSRRLMFFFQSLTQTPSSSLSSFEDVASAVAQRNLFITTGSSEPLLGKCLFFLRTSERAITAANVQQEVNFGMLDCSDGSVLHSLQTLLSHIMLPALKTQQEATSCQHVQHFLSSLDRFVSNLDSVRLSLDQRFELQPVDLPEVIERLQSPADYTNAANNGEVVERLEGVVSLWTNQIRQVLIDSEQLRREADDAGPAAELEHWKRRMVTFNSLMEQVKRPQVKKTLGVLQVAKSRVLRGWRKLDGDITVVANEAKDNVKFLYTLDKFFEPLGKCTPVNVHCVFVSS